MKSRHNIIIWFVINIFVITACHPRSTQSELLQLPNIGISVDEMNKRITMRAPVEINSFKTNSVVMLEIKLISKGTKDGIAFDPDYGTRLFTKIDGQWEEIKNSMIYPGNGYFYLSPSGGGIQSNLHAVTPELSDKGKTMNVWIFVIGHIMINDQVTNEKTGAYIEVELKP
jgi:hypothetical protein